MAVEMKRRRSDIPWRVDIDWWRRRNGQMRAARLFNKKRPDGAGRLLDIGSQRTPELRSAAGVYWFELAL